MWPSSKLLCPCSFAGSIHSPDILLTSAFYEQFHQLTWFQLCLGRLSKNWSAAIIAYQPTIDAPYWSSLFVSISWNFTRSLWAKRNEFVHQLNISAQVDDMLLSLHRTAAEQSTRTPLLPFQFPASTTFLPNAPCQNVSNCLLTIFKVGYHLSKLHSKPQKYTLHSNANVPPCPPWYLLRWWFPKVLLIHPQKPPLPPKSTVLLPCPIILLPYQNLLYILSTLGHGAPSLHNLFFYIFYSLHQKLLFSLGILAIHLSYYPINSFI